ncbi:MAG: hypothetical protein OEN56_14390 [Gemmatimonadota bacterium]|nr:hypothetical protein [Gemmatimonadota bacterium]
MRPGPSSFALVFALSVLILAGCKDDGTTPEQTGDLVVNATAQAPNPSASGAAAGGPSRAPIGAPSSWLIGLYEFHISTNSDCSGPFVQAFSSGGAPSIQDFVTNPVLFTATDLPIGSYPCVSMKITDVMSFQSAVSGGACVAGTTYQGDVYPAGLEPFLDLSLGTIPATGTDAAPGEDGIFLMFSTTPSAVVGRGYSTNQVVPLTSALVIPDEITFSWDASNAVNDTGTSCNLEPDAPAFFW